MDLLKSRSNVGASPANFRKDIYMKNVQKPMHWDIKEKHNIKTIVTDYKMYCNASGYIECEVRVRNFG